MNRQELKDLFGDDNLRFIIENWYIKEQKSTTDIAYEFKRKHDIEVTGNVVYLLLKEYDIKLRSISDAVSLATSNLNYEEKILENNPIVLEAMDGLLISDGTISNDKRAKFHRFSITSSQKEFIELCRSFFLPLCPSDISSKTSIQRDRGYEKDKHGFYTSTHPDITKQRIRWYDGKLKRIPKDIKITPLMLKLWYYGDGSIVTKRGKNNTCVVRLSTDGFLSEDVDFVIEQIELQSGIKSINSDNRIKLKTESIPTFFNYIGRESDLKCYAYKFDVDEWRFWTGMRTVSKEIGIPYNRLNHLAGLKCIEFNRSPGGKKVLFTNKQIDKLRLLHDQNLLTSDPRYNSASITKNSFKSVPKNIEQIYKEIYNKGFPYVNLSDSEKIIIFNRLNNIPVLSIKDGKEILSSFRDNDLAIYFHPHIFSIQSGNKRTPYEAFNDKQSMLMVLQKIYDKNADLSSDNIRYEICRTSKTKRVSVFPVRVAKTIYTKFGKENMSILDPCAGFSSRLLGFYACSKGGKYIGIDPSLKTYNGLIKTQKEIEYMTTNHKSEFYNDTSENILPTLQSESFDMIFTSPPYFNLEKYSDEPTQSFIKYDKYEDWLDKFLFTMITESHRLLKNDGVFALNIANCGNIKIIEHVDKFVRKTFRIENVLLMTSPSVFNDETVEPIFILRKY